MSALYHNKVEISQLVTVEWNAYMHCYLVHLKGIL